MVRAKSESATNGINHHGGQHPAQNLSHTAALRVMCAVDTVVSVQRYAGTPGTYRICCDGP